MIMFKNERSVFNGCNVRQDRLSYIDNVKTGISEIVHERKSAQEG